MSILRRTYLWLSDIIITTEKFENYRKLNIQTKNGV